MSELDRLVRELEQLADGLRTEELDAADAAERVERLAQLAARIGGELEREARAPTPGGAPGQETLL
jgi:hypothetical protein